MRGRGDDQPNPQARTPHTNWITKMAKFSKDKQPATRGEGEPIAQSNKRRTIMTDALMLALNRVADDVLDDDGKPTKQLARIAKKLVEKAAEGDTQAIREVFDRTEGKAAQAIIHQGDEQNPIRTIERIIVEAAEREAAD